MDKQITAGQNLDSELKELEDRIDKKVDRISIEVNNLKNEVKLSSSKTINAVWLVGATVLALMIAYSSLIDVSRSSSQEQSAVIQQTVREILKNRSIEKVVQEAIRKELLAIQSQDNSALSTETKTDSKPAP